MGPKALIDDARRAVAEFNNSVDYSGTASHSLMENGPAYCELYKRAMLRQVKLVPSDIEVLDTVVQKILGYKMCGNCHVPTYKGYCERCGYDW